MATGSGTILACARFSKINTDYNLKFFNTTQRSIYIKIKEERLITLLYYSITITESFKCCGGLRTRWGRLLADLTTPSSTSRTCSIVGSSGIVNTTFLSFYFCCINFLSAWSCFSISHASRASSLSRFFSALALSFSFLLASLIDLLNSRVLSFSFFASCLWTFSSALVTISRALASSFS